ncbi:MAG: glycine cleavage system aminomethyltransferase GcvT [Sedimentisphaerales bacterium]|nr:glycine cleavage system aminomethyltransferase GcvT [Sedimentisphaerales bacterium]
MKSSSGQFIYEPPAIEPTGSLLYAEHLKLTAKSHMAEFAGYIMPLWYSSITAEHNAVRNTAGLFDCTHMGILEVSGSDAADFLNTVTTNEIKDLQIGRAKYSYILDAAGSILDDIIIYRRKTDNFMLVVNAANNLKIKSYFEGLLNQTVVIDAQNSERKLQYSPTITDLRNPDSPTDSFADIALQGPASIQILSLLIADERIQTKMANLMPFHFIETSLSDFDCIISRTGYTGSKVGFELFVHPTKAPQIWQRLLEKGEPLGLVPCGLGARDTLRVEAGLPLYGHELAGALQISGIEAGYSWAVKFQKEFFIGKKTLKAKADKSRMKIARMELPGQKGIRPIRQNDAVLDTKGKCIGWVTSAAKVNEKQIALIYAEKETLQKCQNVGIYYLARSKSQIAQGRGKKVDKGQTLQADIVGTVLSRFAKF